MIQHLIVPVDGSDASWRAADVAVALARRGDATVDVIEVVFDQHDVAEAEARLSERLEQHETSGVSVTTHVRLAADHHRQRPLARTFHATRSSSTRRSPSCWRRTAAVARRRCWAA